MIKAGKNEILKIADGIVNVRKGDELIWPFNRLYLTFSEDVSVSYRGISYFFPAMEKIMAPMPEFPYQDFKFFSQANLIEADMSYFIFTRKNQYEVFPEFQSNGTIKKIIFPYTSLYDISFYHFFKNCVNLEEVIFRTKINITSLKSAFHGCKKIKSINVEKLDTSKCKEAQSCFSGCDSLEELDLSTIDVSKITSFEQFLYGCISLKKIHLNGCNQSSIESISSMFNGCTSMENIEISSLDVSKCKIFTNAFRNCSALELLDLSEWRLTEATGIGSMFYGCNSLKKIIMNNWDVNKVEKMNNVFTNCYALESLDIRGWQTGNVTTMLNMFFACRSLKSLDLSGWNTAKVTNFEGLFNGCISIEEIDISGWDFGKAEDMSSMFYRCFNLKVLKMNNVAPPDHLSVTESCKNFFLHEFNYNSVIQEIHCTTAMRDWIIANRKDLGLDSKYGNTSWRGWVITD